MRHTVDQFDKNCNTMMHSAEIKLISFMMAAALTIQNAFHINDSILIS